MVAQRTVICERIRERLVDVGWSPVDLAAAIRSSEKTVSRWVAMEYAPRSEYLVSIARALDISVLYLLGVRSDPGAWEGGDGGEPVVPLVPVGGGTTNAPT